MNDAFEIKDQPGLAEEVTLSKNVVFEGKIWNVVRKIFNFHGEELAREYIEHPGATAILAIDDDERVVLIKQYRAPVNEYLFEIPAGLLDPTDASTLHAAKRELAEETDYLAAEWQLLQKFYTTPGSSSEIIDIYLATGLEKMGHLFNAEAEEAQLEVYSIPYSDVLRAVKAGKVNSPTLVLAVYALEAKRVKRDGSTR